MQVKCINNEGYLLSRNSVKQGKEQRTKHKGLKVNSLYEVHGIVIFQEDVLYLLIDEFDMPMWYVAELFDIIDSKISKDWHYKFHGYNDRGMTSICGYKELVDSKEHYNGLIEQNKNDIQIFRNITK